MRGNSRGSEAEGGTAAEVAEGEEAAECNEQGRKTL